MPSAVELPGQSVLDLGAGTQLELSALAEEPAPAGVRDDVRQSIDDLVGEAQRYRSSSQYAALLRFAGSMHRYSPYNALLADIQKPGARFLATAREWRDRYAQRVRPNAQPIIFLRPGGPVMFVYDVSDVEAEPGALPLPRAVVDPFGVSFGGDAQVERAMGRLMENVNGFGLRVSLQALGSTRAAHVHRAGPGLLHRSWAGNARRKAKVEDIPLRYDAVVNSSLDVSARFTSFVHEVAHVLCGHLGTPEPAWWPSREQLDHDVVEFEAESVAYVVARRLDSDAVMAPYLHQHLDRHGSTPDFSLERVVKVSGDISSMCLERRPTSQPRKPLFAR